MNPPMLQQALAMPFPGVGLWIGGIVPLIIKDRLRRRARVAERFVQRSAATQIGEKDGALSDLGHARGSAWVPAQV